MKNKSEIQSNCNNCGGIKNHRLLFCEEQKVEDETGFYENSKYCLVKCNGCDNIAYLTILDAAYLDDTEYTYYPSPVFRKKPKWMSEFGFIINQELESTRTIIDEIYSALQIGSPNIAVMGIRSLIEKIMIMKCKDNGGFAKNLKEFSENGHISANQKEKLEHLIEIGHAITHRNYTISSKDVVVLMDILENILESLFSPSRVKEIAKKVPPRHA